MWLQRTHITSLGLNVLPLLSSLFCGPKLHQGLNAQLKPRGSCSSPVLGTGCISPHRAASRCFPTPRASSSLPVPEGFLQEWCSLCSYIGWERMRGGIETQVQKRERWELCGKLRLWRGGGWQRRHHRQQSHRLHHANIWNFSLHGLLGGGGPSCSRF